MHLFSNSIIFFLIGTKFNRFCAIVYYKLAKLYTIDRLREPRNVLN